MESEIKKLVLILPPKNNISYCLNKKNVKPQVGIFLSLKLVLIQGYEERKLFEHKSLSLFILYVLLFVMFYNKAEFKKLST